MNDAVQVVGAQDDRGRETIWHDLIIVVLIVLTAGLLCAALELNEVLFTLTRRWEVLQIDELPAVLFVLATGLAWFSWRRFREARAEVDRRRRAETRLQSLLLENRRLAQQYLQAQESERKYLARELHDELGQYLSAIKTDAVSLQRVADTSPGLLRAAAAINKHADHLYAVVRNLIRELRPVALDELGLKAALEHQLDQCRQRMPHVNFEVSLDGELDSLGESLSLAIYRLMQEGVTNVSRHSDATHVAIRVVRERRGSDVPDVVTLTIADDGSGADLQRTPSGLGLVGMRERAEMLGGKWRVTTFPGEGFRIEASIPLDVPPAAAAI
jgi:two-component system, NarL family, sensor histidine kinase UhpB